MLTCFGIINYGLVGYAGLKLLGGEDYRALNIAITVKSGKKDIASKCLDDH